MEIEKVQLVIYAQWMDEAAICIKKWSEYAPEYFRKKGRITPDIERFEQRAQAIRDLLMENLPPEAIGTLYDKCYVGPKHLNPFTKQPAAPQNPPDSACIPPASRPSLQENGGTVNKEGDKNGPANSA